MKEISSEMERYHNQLLNQHLNSLRQPQYSDKGKQLLKRLDWLNERFDRMTKARRLVSDEIFRIEKELELEER